MYEFLKGWGIVEDNFKLYDIAFSHSSYANEHQHKEDYERLEFLGDAVLQLVMSDYIYRNFEKDEGSMTKFRANYVCENALYQYMKELDLIKYIKVGVGETGNIKKAIVADTFESLMAAIYLRHGFDVVKGVILNIIEPYVLKRENFFADYKSILQEAVQTDRKTLIYETINETGPAHNREFTVIVRIDNIIYGKGIAGSKKEAAQEAAREALMKLAKSKNE